jgi:hypothetical protein
VGALLDSPFNVMWRWYVQSGGVEESKFSRLLVVFPVRCISSVSPRFYFRRYAFCLLPLAAILESQEASAGAELHFATSTESCTLPHNPVLSTFKDHTCHDMNHMIKVKPHKMTEKHRQCNHRGIIRCLVYLVDKEGIL